MQPGPNQKHSTGNKTQGKRKPGGLQAWRARRTGIDLLRKEPALTTLHAITISNQSGRLAGATSMLHSTHRHTAEAETTKRAPAAGIDAANVFAPSGAVPLSS